MKTPRSSPPLAALLVAVIALFGAFGCVTSGPKPPKRGPGYTYTVKLGDSLGVQRFKVDVVPVNASNKERILAMSVDDYFNNKDNIRSGISNLKSQLLSKGDTLVVDLEEKALQQYRFPGYSHIAVIADSTVRGSNPNNDQRRILLPLDPTLWQRDWPGKKREIAVTFSSAGVESSPGPISQ